MWEVREERLLESWDLKQRTQPGRWKRNTKTYTEGTGRERRPGTWRASREADSSMRADGPTRLRHPSEAVQTPRRNLAFMKHTGKKLGGLGVASEEDTRGTHAKALRALRQHCAQAHLSHAKCFPRSVPCIGQGLTCSTVTL